MVAAHPRAFALGYIMSPLRGFPIAFRRLLQTAGCGLPSSVASFLISARLDPLFSSKSVASFFEKLTDCLQPFVFLRVLRFCLLSFAICLSCFLPAAYCFSSSVTS